MFLRLLFVLLAALNIAVGAWLLLGQPYARGGSVSDPGVPELRLLSEVAAAASAGVINAPTIAPTPSIDVASTAPATPVKGCLTLGPFATPQDLRNARQALTSRVLSMRSRQEQTAQNVGWRVFLPALRDHAQALAEARKLEAHQIHDYFVVSAGDQANTISLGLFKDRSNAQHRREDLVAAGFPATMAERTETVPQYWLDLSVADRDHFSWRDRVAAGGVGSHSAACF